MLATAIGTTFHHTLPLDFGTHDHLAMKLTKIPIYAYASATSRLHLLATHSVV